MRVYYLLLLLIIYIISDTIIIKKMFFHVHWNLLKFRYLYIRSILFIGFVS